MHQPTSVRPGHSSAVDMLLHAGSQSFSVLQASQRAIKLNDSDAVTQGEALLEIIVDGRSHRRPIWVIGPSSRPRWIEIEDR
jgi:hypothetical protein